jgi:hypothetical protein
MTVLISVCNDAHVYRRSRCQPVYAKLAEGGRPSKIDSDEVSRKPDLRCC